MNIHQNQQGNTVTLKLEGRLDRTTAPDLDAAVNRSLDKLQKLVLDFEQVEYISSAGLRVLLGVHRKMAANQTMVIRNINEFVEYVFTVTGFINIFTVERQPP